MTSFCCGDSQIAVHLKCCIVDLHLFNYEAFQADDRTETQERNGKSAGTVPGYSSVGSCYWGCFKALLAEMPLVKHCKALWKGPKEPHTTPTPTQMQY